MGEPFYEFIVRMVREEKQQKEKHMMEEYLPVNVLPVDIRKANKCKKAGKAASHCCPNYQAIRRITPSETVVTVDGRAAFIGAKRASLPAEAIKVVDQFDNNQPVDPASFTLCLK